MLGQIFTKNELLRILGKIDAIFKKNGIEFPDDLNTKLAALRQDISCFDAPSDSASAPSVDGTVHDAHHELEGALNSLLQWPVNTNKLLVLHAIFCILNDPLLVGDRLSNLDAIRETIKTHINDLAIKIIQEAPRTVTLQQILFVSVLHDYLQTDARSAMKQFMIGNPNVLTNEESAPSNATLLQYQYAELQQMLQNNDHQTIIDLVQQGCLTSVINYASALVSKQAAAMRVKLIMALIQNDELIGKWLFAQTPQAILGLVKLIDTARIDGVLNSVDEKAAALRFESALQQGLISVIRYMPLECAHHLQGLRELLDYLYEASNPLCLDKVLFRAAMYELADNHRHRRSAILDELDVKNKYGFSFTIARLTADAILFCKRSEATLLQRASSVTSFASTNTEQIPEGPRERLLQG